jgi:hypothetical protein
LLFTHFAFLSQLTRKFKRALADFVNANRDLFVMMIVE